MQITIAVKKKKKHVTYAANFTKITIQELIIMLSKNRVEIDREFIKIIGHVHVIIFSSFNEYPIYSLILVNIEIKSDRVFHRFHY